MNSETKIHWDNVYLSKEPTETSWYQKDPTMSLNLIADSGISHSNSIVDIGGGASLLVDKLLAKGFQDLTVLDISDRALQYAQNRLAKQASKVKWIAMDITEFESPRQFDLWHDRAVFHFLTADKQKEKYKQCLNKALVLNGYLILATFALDGPMKCSGLEVERYDATKLQAELGDNFNLLKVIEEHHLTPWGAEQKFNYSLFRKISSQSSCN